MEIILIIIGCLILIALYKIYGKIEDIYYKLNSWYGDWKKIYDSYEPPKEY